MHSTIFATKSSPLLLILSFIFLYSNCAEDNPVQIQQGTKPKISNLVTPAVVYNGSPNAFTISVKVSDPQGQDNLKDVSYEIIKSGSTSPVTGGELLDDGSHGDVIAKDGVFTNLLDSTFVRGDTGEFQISIFALDKDGHRSETLTAPLLVKSGNQNLAPQILAFNIPATVPVDSTFDLIFTVQVTDPEGLADIAGVNYRFFPPAHAFPTEDSTMADDGTFGDQIPGDGIYTASLPDSVFNKLADYSLRIQAVDKAGNLSTAVVAYLRGRLSITGAPKIVAVFVPRMINANTTNEVVIRAEVTDTEGIADIKTVQFQAFLPDNSETGFSPVLMFDDGDVASHGDGTANDGTFSALFPAPQTGSTPIKYRLVFTARDQRDSVSTQVRQHFVVGFDDSPYISGLVAPAQVQINPNVGTRILLTLDVRDPQGLTDIDTVGFRSFLPNGEEAKNSPIRLSDNGNQDEGDEVSGDGIFSRFIFLPPTGVMKGDFRFVFEARDMDENVSNQIEHILTVL